MTTAKTLILGRSGQVGFELRNKLAGLGHIAQVEYPRVDLSQPDTIRKAVRATEPAIIINAAAYTAVDKAESEPGLATAINGVAPGILAEEAKRLGSLLIHYSTDYVFDGTKQGPYIETDTPNPLNVYGKTKLAGDRAIQSVGGDYLILRTSWVYGARGQNFLFTVLRLASERSELRIVDDQVGAPTSSECIAQATTDILAQLSFPAKSGLRGRGGVYNLTNSGETTWFGFASAILAKQAAISGSAQPNLIPIRTVDFPRPARRPANSRLSCKLLDETFGARMPDWQDALSGIFERLREGAAPKSGNP